MFTRNLLGTIMRWTVSWSLYCFPQNPQDVYKDCKNLNNYYTITWSTEPFFSPSVYIFLYLVWPKPNGLHWGSLISFFIVSCAVLYLLPWRWLQVCGVIILQIQWVYIWFSYCDTKIAVMQIKFRLPLDLRERIAFC